jgi:hypothetical protein
MYYKMPELATEEKKLPLAKYWEKYPLLMPPPLHRQLLDAGPMKLEDAVPAERWLDLLQIEGYRKVEYGYCMMPDSSGYYVEYYLTPPAVKREMRAWFGKWVNIKSKSMVPGQGNLRYKLWCPVDHWDHKFVNGTDGSDGIWAFGTLDLGKSGAKNGSAETSHSINLRDYGLTEKRENELKEAGCAVRAVYEEVEGGHHLVLSLTRPCPFGGTETLSHEWIGWYAKDGKIVRDEGTPVSEGYLKNVLEHNVVEHMHLPRFLPELYAEYHDKPMDAD